VTKFFLVTIGLELLSDKNSVSTKRQFEEFSVLNGKKVSFQYLIHFFCELKVTIFNRFEAANYDFELRFFPTRQVSEIPNEFSKNTERIPSPIFPQHNWFWSLKD
jgi:hypothetical protein